MVPDLEFIKRLSSRQLNDTLESALGSFIDDGRIYCLYNYELGFTNHTLEENLQRDKNQKKKREFSREREKSQIKKRIFFRRDFFREDSLFMNFCLNLLDKM